MIGQWLVRICLVIAAFFLGSFGSFFLLMLVTWDQSLLDLLGVLAGVVLASLTFVKSRAITRPRVGNSS